MNKFIKAGVAALTLTAVAVGAALPADAQSRRDYRYDRSDRYDRDRHDNTGVAIAAGVLGLALGAALSSNNRNDRYASNTYSNTYSNGYYSNGYDSRYRYDDYGRSYDPYYGRTCERDTRTWDRYGRPVVIRQQYAC